MAELKEKFGLRILVLRKKAKLSQEQLGDRLGISRGSVSRLERGEIGLKFDNIEAIAKIFGVEEWELFKFS
ncbi:hypothetical protein MNBD_GAMMA10-97 [hydrothermal vent metagenome]|uniref:HTH cro/C1-type domain-containing protein n=1 Tax=hydrothermal vent metagenome TaxID=652676 RepID=A0A3B0YGX3_9ZZZZ